MKRLSGALLLLFPWPAWAFQSNSGGNTAQFLQVGAGARALGMGEAYGPVAEGVDAIYWNPAGLAQLRGPEVSYTRSEFLGFFHHDFLAAATPIKLLKGTLGFSYTRLSQESLPVVTNANINIGDFTPHSDAFALAYAHAFDLEDLGAAGGRDYFEESYAVPGAWRPLKAAAAADDPWTGTLLVGLSIKAIDESLYQTNATAAAIDGGVIFRPASLQDLSLSFAFRNAGGRERFIQESENLPAEADFGIAYNRTSWKTRLVPAFEFALPYYGNPYAKFGLEYHRPVAEGIRVALRAGYKTQTAGDLSPISGITFGLGAELRHFTIDFGFQPLAELGQVYRMSAGWRW